MASQRKEDQGSLNVLTYTDYRKVLKTTLERRLESNPRYSLRAFARDLGMGAGRLSCVLRTKKGLSPRASTMIAQRLGLNEIESSYFFDLVSKEHSRSDRTRKLASERIDMALSARSFDVLESESFQMVSGWYHLAVLELMGTKDFSSQHDWIAHRLGITPFEAEEALGRLERLKFIEKTTDGYKKSPSFFSTTRNIPSQAIREYQKKILLKAMDAIELQSVQEREISSTTMPIPVSRIPEAQNLITEFRRRLESLLSDPNNKNDEVYCLSIQFFRLTHLSTQSAKENLEA